MARDFIKMSGGTYTGSALLVGKAVKVHGSGATFNVAASAIGFDIGDAAELQLSELNIIQVGTSSVFDCRTNAGPAPVLGLRNVTIDAAGTAVLAYGCTASLVRTRIQARSTTYPSILAAPTSNVTVERSIIDGGAGIQSEGTGSIVRINNSVIVNTLGSNGAAFGSNVFAGGVGALTISFSTIVGAHFECSPNSPPPCAGGSEFGACIENSIVVADPSNDAVQGQCLVKYSLVTPQGTVLLGANNKANVSPSFQDAGTDFHLQMQSPAVDAADPSATNAVDYDGVVRPQGARRDMGAFEYK